MKRCSGLFCVAQCRFYPSLWRKDENKIKINKNPKTNKEKKYLEKRFALSFPEEHEKTSEGKLGFSIAAPSSILLTPDAFEVKTVFRGYLRTNRLQLSFMVNVIIKQA